MNIEIKADNPLVIEKSFDGKHEIQFNEKSHRYKWLCECHKGQPSTGVTTFTKGGFVTSVGLITWQREESCKWLFEQLKKDVGPLYSPEKRDALIKEAKTVDRGTAQEAADIGTIVHDFAEYDSRGKTEEAFQRLARVEKAAKYSIIKKCVDQYLDWKSKHPTNLRLAENLIASPTHSYCGKFDRIDEINGKLRLRDYKTSKDIYLDQFIQLAAYRLAFKEWMNIDIEELEVVRFGKEDESFETLLINDPAELEMFTQQAIRCRQTYEFLKLGSDPRFDWRKR